MKRRAENPFIRSEGLLIAAALVLMLVFCLAAYLHRLPAEETLMPVHAVSVEKLRRAEMMNVNLASAGELAELPGIGEELARRIVEYRTLNGPFQTVEEIMNVPGIGEGKLESMREWIFLE